MMSSVPSRTKSSTYYEKGCLELATEDAITVQKLEKRRKLTPNNSRMVIVLVGLPGRGKSFVARKLQHYLTWRGIACQIFNVGRYRRQAHAEVLKNQANEETDDNTRENVGACDANFFDPSNKAAADLRQAVAAAAMKDMLRWVHDVEDADKQVDQSSASLSAPHSFEDEMIPSKDRIAIFDATNSTDERRKWVLEQCKDCKQQTGVVFVESICDDQELLEANFRFKVSNSPDFKGISTEEALEDLRQRVRKYEEKYETIDDDSQSYIKIFNLSSKILVNHIYGRMAKVIVPAIMAWNIGTRPVFLCRSGMTSPGACTDEEDYVNETLSEPGLSDVTNRIALRGDNLGEKGMSFRSVLSDFIQQECKEFFARRDSAVFPDFDTGTSITGISKGQRQYGRTGKELPFTCVLMSSTMPRAAQTATWDDPAFPVEQLSSLNPMDKGDLAGKDIPEIQKCFADFYSKLAENPFHTRFPGGESYKDVISRVEPIIIDLEMALAPVLCVSHLSVLQVMMAYFRNSPVEKCSSIEIPMHTVIKYTPVRGGGWSESQHSFLGQTASDSNCSRQDPYLYSSNAAEASDCLIWGDHIPTKFH